jgi:3-hydroxyacyl-CoA dehydrogenase
MHWAERQGLAHIHARLLHWREALGDYGAMWFTPSPARARRRPAAPRFPPFS